MKSAIRAFLPVAAFLLVPLTAWGQTFEPLGEIIADFDGRRIEQQTVQGTANGETNGTATVQTMHGMTMVALYTSARDQLNLEMTYMGGGAPDKTEPSESTISYFTDGIRGKLWRTTEESGAQITISRYELDGGKGHITGSFEATLCWQEEMFGEPDPQNCKPISGTFDTELLVEE